MTYPDDVLAALDRVYATARSISEHDPEVSALRAALAIAISHLGTVPVAEPIFQLVEPDEPPIQYQDRRYPTLSESERDPMVEHVIEPGSTYSVCPLCGVVNGLTIATPCTEYTPFWVPEMVRRSDDRDYEPEADEVFVCQGCHKQMVFPQWLWEAGNHPDTAVAWV